MNFLDPKCPDIVTLAVQIADEVAPGLPDTFPCWEASDPATPLEGSWTIYVGRGKNAPSVSLDVAGIYVVTEMRSVRVNEWTVDAVVATIKQVTKAKP